MLVPPGVVERLLLGRCLGEVSHDDYEAIVADLVRFLEGDSDEVVARLRTDMEVASKALDFEVAARHRDRLASVLRALEKQQNPLEPRHGLELWRQFHREHEPRVKSRFGGMLTQILQTKLSMLLEMFKLQEQTWFVLRTRQKLMLMM